MSSVTVIWSMVASACLTLAVIYFLVWWSNRTALGQSALCHDRASTAAFTLCELRQMRVGTSEELLSAMRWTHVALLGVLVSTAWFVTFYLGAGRRWLAWTFSGLRVFYLLVAFLIWGNVNYLEITSLRRVPFLGDSVTVFARHTESMDAVRLRDDVADPRLCRGCQRHGLAARRAPKGADDRGQCRILSFARHRSRPRWSIGPNCPSPFSSARSTSAWSS